MAKVVKQRAPKRPVKKSVKKKGVNNRRPTVKKRTDEFGLPGLKRPVAIALYGPGGVGKTSWAAHWPKPGFVIGRDKGILDLVDYGQVPEPVTVKEAENWEQVLQSLVDLADSEVQTVILDNLSDFEELCFQYHCREYFNNDWSKQGFYNYYQGPKNAAKTDWPEMLTVCNALLDAGINVVMIAHSKIKNTPNPGGTDWMRYEPNLDAEIWSRTHYWAKCTFFYSLHVEVKKDGQKGKADSDEYTRMLFTDPSPTYEAKNRLGLTPVIDCGESAEEAFNAFLEALSK